VSGTKSGGTSLAAQFREARAKLRREARLKVTRLEGELLVAKGELEALEAEKRQRAHDIAKAKTHITRS
jgi:hypothetical protein